MVTLFLLFSPSFFSPTEANQNVFLLLSYRIESDFFLERGVPTFTLKRLRPLEMPFKSMVDWTPQISSIQQWKCDYNHAVILQGNTIWLNECSKSATLARKNACMDLAGKAKSRWHASEIHYELLRMNRWFHAGVTFFFQERRPIYLHPVHPASTAGWAGWSFPFMFANIICTR